MVYSTLNKLKWTGKLGECKIIILHRGAPKDEKTIMGRDITEVKKSHFLCRDGERETYIPMHRVLRIILEGKAIWERKRKS